MSGNQTSSDSLSPVSHVVPCVAHEEKDVEVAEEDDYGPEHLSRSQRHRHEEARVRPVPQTAVALRVEPAEGAKCRSLLCFTPGASSAATLFE